MLLEPEPSAHVEGKDAHPLRRPIEPLRELGQCAVRGLMGDRERQLSVAVDLGQHRPCLHRDRGVAMDPHLLGDDDIGVGNRLRGVALLHRHRAEDVLSPILVELRRARLEGRPRVGDHGQRVIGDLNQSGGVLSDVPVLGQHDGDRVADKANLVPRQDRIGLLLLIGDHLEDLDLLEAPLLEIGRGQDRLDARQRSGGRGVDRLDPSVGLRAAHEGELQRAGDTQIVGVAPGAREQPRVLDPRNAAADKPLRTDALGDLLRRCCAQLHRCEPIAGRDSVNWCGRSRLPRAAGKTGAARGRSHNLAPQTAASARRHAASSVAPMALPCGLPASLPGGA